MAGGSSPQFPYEYGSDLHWLWGWGYRIRSHLEKSPERNEWDCAIFRPDRSAADAMMQFSVAYPHIIKQVQDRLTLADTRYEKLLQKNTWDTSDDLSDAMFMLAERIEAAARTIADAERHLPPSVFYRQPISTPSYHARLTRLAELFLDGSKKWPNVESLLFTWPEGKPSPQLPAELDGHYAIPIPGGGLNFIVSYTGGQSHDTPAQRFRTGRSGMHVIRRDFSRLWGDPREIKDSEEENEYGQRLKHLVQQAAKVLDQLPQTPFGICDAMVWSGSMRWFLAVHALVNPDDRPAINGATCERFRDIYEASATACDILLTTQETVSRDNKSDGTEPCRHSIDFRSVVWFGRQYTFSATQAACMKVLWEHWEQDTPAVGEQTILEAAGSTATRLRDVFKEHAAWGTMITPAGKGAFRLSQQ